MHIQKKPILQQWYTALSIPLMALTFAPGCGNQLIRKSGEQHITPSYRLPESQTKKPQKATPQIKDPHLMTRKELIASYLDVANPKQKKAALQGKLRENSLDFLVKNGSGKTIFLTCFSYIKKEKYSSWRWDKSPVYKVHPDEEGVINIDEITNETVRKNVFGYLAVFDTHEKALRVTPQLTDSRRQLDLDLLYKLHGKTVVVEVVKYGYIEDRIDYHLASKGESTMQTELDFEVENQTGKPIYVTCFIYEQQQDSDEYTPWAFSKTNIQLLEPGERMTVDVSSIKDIYDWVYMRGNLAIFDINEAKLAEDSTYELLDAKHKIALGRLSTIQGKKVLLHIERYGSTGDFIDYTTSPAKPVSH